MNADTLYRDAQRACQEGRLAEGIELIRKALAIEPKRAGAHWLLGMALGELGRMDEALASLDRAIACQPDLADAHGSRGDVLAALDRLPEAIDSYSRALELAPDSVANLCNRGATLADAGRYREALVDFDRAAALAPDRADVHVNRGSVLIREGREIDALASFERALAIAPEHPGALMCRGEALRTSGQFEAALQSYCKVLERIPNHVAALAAQGTALGALNRHEEAVASFNRAIAVGADSFEVRLNHGTSLYKLHRHEEALASFRQALARRPDDVSALYNLGLVLGTMGRPAEAVAAYEALLKIEPDHVDALLNHGCELQQLHRHREAVASFARLTAVQPDHVDAHVNEALALLTLGEFQSGWPKFEWRLKKSGFEVRQFAQPVWRGEPIAGKVLFLHAEQGAGDSINMVRYVPLAAQMGAVIVLEVPPPLKELMLQVKGAASVIARGELIPAFDYQCPLMSLPLAFKTRPDTIPAGVPYLVADQERVQAWSARLPSSGRLRVGMNWHGNPAFRGDQVRSMTLDQFAPLLATPGVDFFCLNPGISSGDASRLAAMPNVFHIAAEFRDFSDTAAVMSELDVIVTTDTSVAHLAGALGRPLWIILSHVPDWRFGLDAESNRWYPTARLFRQPAAGDWGAVLNQVQRELTTLAASR